MKCIRFDVCKLVSCLAKQKQCDSSMKCIRFDVCKNPLSVFQRASQAPQ